MRTPWGTAPIGRGTVSKRRSRSSRRTLKLRVTVSPTVGWAVLLVISKDWLVTTWAWAGRVRRLETRLRKSAKSAGSPDFISMSLGALPLSEKGDERLGIGLGGLGSNQITPRFPNLTLQRAVESMCPFLELLPDFGAAGIYQPMGLRFGIEKGDEPQVRQLPLPLLVELAGHHAVPPAQPLQRRFQAGRKKIRDQEHDRAPPQNRIGKA